MNLLRPLVVCVDDEAPVLRALQRTLGRSPYDLRTTSRPEEALRWSRERTLDVLVTDQRMPGMAGTELVEAVRERSPETSWIVLTAYPDPAIRPLILKPWDDAALRRTVDELVRRRSHLSRLLARSATAVDHFLGRLAPAPSRLGIRTPGGGSGELVSAFARSPKRPASRSLGVLIVEDHDDSREFLKTLLERAGHSCEEAASVEQAIRWIDTRVFDVVLIDLGLPNGDGLAVARHVVGKGLKTRVVVVSAHLDRRQMPGEYAALGVDAFVPKPYGMKEILDAIRGR